MDPMSFSLVLDIQILCLRNLLINLWPKVTTKPFKTLFYSHNIHNILAQHREIVCD